MDVGSPGRRGCYAWWPVTVSWRGSSARKERDEEEWWMGTARERARRTGKVLGRINSMGSFKFGAGAVTQAVEAQRCIPMALDNRHVGAVGSIRLALFMGTCLNDVVDVSC